MNTPIRRLNGVTYWVIEDPDGIRDFINTEIRKEWEEDAKFVAEDPARDSWLRTLQKRKWRLEIVRFEQVSLDQNMMNYVDKERGYSFSRSLATRRRELRTVIEQYRAVIWPIIVSEEDMQIHDGFCRYTALTEMGISRLYAYIGTL